MFFENSYYNHSDHRTAGMVALDAAFPGTGNPHFFSEHLGEGLDVQEAHDVWLGWTNEPNHVEDITGHLATKVAALAAHASQLAEGVLVLRGLLEKEAAEAGAKVGVEHAEGFRVLDLPRPWSRREDHLAEVVEGVGESLGEHRVRAPRKSSQPAGPSMSRTNRPVAQTVSPSR